LPARSRSSKRKGARRYNPSAAAKNLRRLRDLTGLSIADMARELGMPASSYQHYEARYEKPRLPRELALRVAKVLIQHGVSEADLATLGVVQEVHSDVNKLAHEVHDLKDMVLAIMVKLGITRE
jgi:DNA-binding transcriptional regulator YiaG